MVVLAQMMDRGDHMDNGNGWWWVMGIGALIVLALFVVLIVVLLRRETARNHRLGQPSMARRRPESVLADRRPLLVSQG
jgi:uncharacterized membrane protein